MTYANKIKALCKQKNIPVSRLEKDLGFSNGYVITLKDKMPTDRAVMIAEYFGLPSDYFFPGQQKKSSPVGNPLIEELMVKASNLTEAELTELLSFEDYILSKHKDT